MNRVSAVLRDRLVRRSLGPSLAERFIETEGPLVDKWDSYFPVYERHLGRFRGQRPHVLEIGVSHGGAIDVLSRWLGRGTTFVGLDVEPRCRELARPGLAIEIGDQSDSEVLRSLVERHGPFDIVIDDGSHFGDHQIVTMEHLWPHLVDGGVYLVEDTHTNYWERKRGGLRRPGTFVEFAKTIADDLTAFHSQSDDFVVTDWTRSVDSVSFHDSIVVIEKRLHDSPGRVRAGRPVFPDLYGNDLGEMLSAEHEARIVAMNRPGRRIRRALRSPRRTIETLRRRFRG